jgi:phospholipid/cholesterol/gamma-HCH transport system substrate-binding protein
MRKVIGNRALGVLFICLLLLGVWVVNAVFSQKFLSFDKVSLKTDTIGLQLPARADVKVRGVIVGQVLEAKSGTDGATLTLGIKPDEIKLIPDNVTASILPKTLFGEKYVELVIPAGTPQGAPELKKGDTITQTALPIEVERVLNDLYPLLRAVQPAELNYTLNAISSALEGRGEAIGKNIETLDSYLKRLNPQVPELISDLRLLSKVSDTYADVAPQIAATLRNTVKTGNTLKDRQAKLNAFFKDTASFSGTAKTFLDANGDNIVRLGQISAPQLKLLDRYSPEFPCLLNGLVDQAPLLASTFRGFVFHIDLITIPQQPRGYGPQDKQVYGADNGPACLGLPSPKVPFRGIPNFNDGVDKLGRGDAQRPAPFGAGTNADLGSLLYGPLVSGAGVSN